ncbi:MAG: LamG-like jellyroll fold domain-containing protein [Planctomycetaceae bacterium]
MRNVFQLAVLFGLMPVVSWAELKAGAAVTDITPPKLPVIVNGGMRSRTVDKINTRISARSLAVSDGKTTLVIVVADSCMMPKSLLDETKQLASKRTGVPADHMLISATHAHSAPSSMAALGTDADLNYVPFIKEKLAESIVTALAEMKPAEVGFGKGNAADFTALRRWIRRPDRIGEDPFGNKTVRATMHAARNLDNVTGESGPEDPDLSLISFRSKTGKPIAVLANFSMHYFSDRDISADYFGHFCNDLRDHIAPGSAFVGIMSHGCSGDIWRRDYTKPDNWDPKQTIRQYATGLVDITARVYEGIEYRSDVDVAMVERRLKMKYRVPNQQRLAWAKTIVAEMGDRLPETQPEIYAREQVLLHELQETEIVVQALRIGDIGIATTPCETYAITGLKIKAASPLPHNMVIELANGGDGYIPPPEQHLFGGYNTWAARSAGLEVQAEPKIAEACIGLLEQVSGKARRSTGLSRGAAAEAMAVLKPHAWWRLNELAGPIAVDSSGNNHHATYEPHVTFYLEGPHSNAFCKNQTNRAAMFVGGRVHARMDKFSNTYTIAGWIWNGLPNDARDVTGWIWSRDRNHGLNSYGVHFGLGGKTNPGRLMLLQGTDDSSAIVGQSEIKRWQWHHVAVVRDGTSVQIYVDGKLDVEGTIEPIANSRVQDFFIGGRSDNSANWEGRLDEFAIFQRALSAKEIAALVP